MSNFGQLLFGLLFTAQPESVVLQSKEWNVKTRICGGNSSWLLCEMNVCNLNKSMFLSYSFQTRCDVLHLLQRPRPFRERHVGE